LSPSSVLIREEDDAWFQDHGEGPRNVASRRRNLGRAMGGSIGEKEAGAKIPL